MPFLFFKRPIYKELLNPEFMNTTITQQEILLVTGTSFSATQWEKKEGQDDSLTERQRLEEACWNGMLREMLPEIYEKTSRTMYLWKVKEGASFIELELGESPVTIESISSIDPYSFLPYQNNN